MNLDENEIKRVFKQLDYHQSGSIERSELGPGLRKLGVRTTPCSEDILWHELLGFDENKDGVISYEEFKEFAQMRTRALKTLFDELDLNGDGKLSASEVSVGLARFGLSASPETVRKMLRNLPRKSDVDVPFEEFREMTLLAPSLQLSCIFQVEGAQWTVGYFNVPKHDVVASDAAVLLMSGGIAGLLSRTATAPMDRIKVILQASPGSSILETARAIANEPGGTRNFWKGNGANVCKIVPESAIKFYTNEYFKSIIVRDTHDMTNIRFGERLAAGSLAGICSQAAVYPMELVKTRLNLAAPGSYNGIIDCTLAVCRREGYGALFKGLSASLMGIVPYAGVDLAVYGATKDWYLRAYPDSSPRWYELLGIGSMSCIAGQLVAYPFQIVRTRLQSGGLPNYPTYSTNAEVAGAIFKAEGLRGFYRGLAANFMKSVPAIALSYVAYEKSKETLQSSGYFR